MTLPMPTRYILGLDLGKISDHTALAICEERPESVKEDGPRAVLIPRWSDDPDYAVPWLERWPLQTAYHHIAAAIENLVAELVARPRAEVRLFVDATGVGGAVIEMLAAQPAIKTLGLDAVTITAGHETTSGREGGHRTWHVPKKELVGAAQVALQRGKLKVAAGLPEAATLTAELRTFEARITEAAHMQFSHREGAHDDLALYKHW